MSVNDESVGLGRRGCLGLLLAGVAFVVLTFVGLIYVMTRPQDSDIEAGERAAIEACWKSAQSTERSFTEESCKEMEKQFVRKFERQP
ncbi:conserved hypothetical protein [Pseudomonas sp. 8Z]|uniref:hypothetical protein n=1 Tax=Pseudomonas sp. 8Z TaxID=2653166 RepID=UPI0012F38ACC|nr:hypothetical protein [Pseudomonas sp. 8Z]VXC60535.1 conserved hypothetical protein [Pseudomonas sp. 8Z]